MSVPPSNDPPGNYYYGQPQGRPQNSNAGCLKAFGITCAVLILLGIIGVALLFKAGAPYFQKFMQFGQSITQATKDGRTIQQAVVAYHAKKGKYPSNLTALVADGEITDAKILHSDQDSNPSPGHISWQYQRPKEGAPGSTPILDLPYHLSVGGRTQAGDLIINLDGSTPRHPGYERVQRKSVEGPLAPNSGGAGEEN